MAVDWAFGEDNSSGQLWASHPTELVAHVEYRRDGYGGAKRRLKVVTKSWVEAQLRQLDPHGHPPAFGAFGPMMVVPDGSLPELRRTIQSALELVATDAFSLPVE